MREITTYLLFSFMNKYSYIPQTQVILPPLFGMYSHAGYISYLFKAKPDGTKERISHNLQESYGKTEKEAIKKAKESLETWLREYDNQEFTLKQE